MTDTYSPQANPWQTWAGQLDPTGQRYADAGAWLGQPQIAYGSQTPPDDAQYYDPASMQQADTYSPNAMMYGSALTNAYLDQYHQQHYGYLDQAGNPAAGANNAGAVTDLGNTWATVDKLDPMIQKAVQTVAQQTGTYVPVNFVKAIIQEESGGLMLAPNTDAAQGIMQINTNAWGYHPFGEDITTPQGNINAGVRILADNYQAGNPTDASQKSWEWAAKRYLGLGGADSLGTDDNAYWSRVNGFWSQLGAGGAYQQQQGTGAVAPGTTTFSSIWHGGDAPITQIFGMTDFARAQLALGAGNEYDYTSQYTLDGQPIGHAGIDVGVQWGTPLYAPAGGKISIIGSEDGQHYYYRMAGPGPDGTPAMGAEINANNAGELAVTMANGDVYILGHMSQIVGANQAPYAVGDIVQPGQFVGYSGGSNGAHVHVEYRKYLGPPGTGTATGYEVVDPQQAFSGNFTGTYSATGPGGPAGLASASDDWQQFMRASILGLPNSGMAPSGQTSFHDFLRNFMTGQGNAGANQASDSTTWVLGGGGTLGNAATQNKTG